jgi:hypothetical protein
MKSKMAAIFLLLLTGCLLATADEGLWLFERPPVERIKASYGFVPSQAWLDHLRLGSVRFSDGGSGSFVSADGLVFTNHHVGRGCLQDLSTKARDYTRSGFYAKRPAEEQKCPDFELDVLEQLEDVTAKVHGAAKPGMPAAEAARAQREVMSQLEAACAGQADSQSGSPTPQRKSASTIRCEVVTFYAGGLYHLYRYRKYTDVRVVFAPEEQIAFFGGDPDNFEYPRYDLDIAFFRAYENGKPARLNQYLRFSHNGIREGDLVFVSGNPGRTERLLTMAQLESLRDVVTPFALEVITGRYQDLLQFTAISAENARIGADEQFGLENALKAYKGRLAGLTDPELMGKKAAGETALRAAVERNPAMNAAYGGAWDAIARAIDREKQFHAPYYFIENMGGFAGTEPHLARLLVRLVMEKQKPNEQRLREYSESRLPSLEQRLFSTAPIYKSLDTILLASSLAMMRDKLGADDRMVRLVLKGKAPQALAKDAVENTRINDVAFRRQLYEGGPRAIEQSADPLIVLMREIEPIARELRKRWEDQVESALHENGTLIAKARFAVEGTDIYPDATFTLRLSYGAAKGYRQGGQMIPYTTTFDGAFEHAARHGNMSPYDLPKSWLAPTQQVQDSRSPAVQGDVFAAKPGLNLITPFNFVSTADIIGGNSGSPVVDRQGEVVGIVFDGNIQSLPWDFQYDDRQGRAIQVDSRAILESLRVIYHANALVDELMRGKRK